MRPPPIESMFDEEGRPTSIWIEWFKKELYPMASFDLGTGTTAQRPTSQLQASSRYFDTTLGIPIFYDGTNWIDASGTTV